MKQNPKLVSLLTFFWLVCYTKLLFAATLSPFTQDIRGFDFESMAAAAGAGLLGGAGRTIYSLASEKILVGNLWREGIKDAILALMGGAVVWYLATMMSTFFPAALTREVRMLLIVAAGASRGRWADWVWGLLAAALAGLRYRVLGTTAGTPPSEPPSAITPLNESK